MEGWKKLQERLGNNCFLIADNNLKKGLPIRDPNHRPESVKTISEEPELAQTDEHNEVVYTDKPSLSYLSCGTVTLEATLTETLCKATHIKGTGYSIDWDTYCLLSTL